jgi:dihydrofolate reductase
MVMGGGQICHAVLAEGLADVLTLHVAPVVLGSGTRLFPATAAPSYQLELTDTVSTPKAQHLTYRVAK